MFPMRGAQRDKQLNADKPITRRQEAVIALHDFGSKPKATAASVRKAMREAGFTYLEIARAARDYSSCFVE